MYVIIWSTLGTLFAFLFTVPAWNWTAFAVTQLSCQHIYFPNEGGTVMQCPEKQSSKENKRLHRSISEPSNFSELWEDLEAEPVS